MVWVQAIRSQAVNASSSHTALIPNIREGGLQCGQLSGFGVGGEGLEPPAVDVGEGRAWTQD
jgi:hypothetical protein